MNDNNLDPRKAVEARFEVLDSSTGEPLQADAEKKTASQRGNEQLAAIGYKFANLILLAVGQYVELLIEDRFRGRERR
jgi:hypothetical protein